MRLKLNEYIKDLEGVVPVSTQDASTDTWIDASHYERVAAIGMCGELTSGKIMTVQLRQATDASGTSAKDLGTAATFTASDGDLSGTAFAEAEVRDMDGDNDFLYVGVRVTTDEGSSKICAAALLLADYKLGIVS